MHAVMKAVDSGNLWAAFNDPVVHSQQAFRLILRAVSEPGEEVSFDGLLDGTQPGAGIADASFITALVLLDQDTRVWISPAMAQPAFIDNLRFHCGAALVASPEQADFAFVSLQDWISMNGFKKGSEENPHQAATLIIQIASHRRESAANGQGLEMDAPVRKLLLSGPGVCGKRPVSLPGIRDKHISLLQRNHQTFPLGNDFLFTFGRGLLAMPRSTRIDAPHDIPESSLALEGVS